MVKKTPLARQMRPKMRPMFPLKSSYSTTMLPAGATPARVGVLVFARMGVSEGAAMGSASTASASAGTSMRYISLRPSDWLALSTYSAKKV